MATHPPPADREGWHVVCAVEDLKPTRPLPFQIAGQQLVAFRRADGATVCVHDRCSHRGHALAAGTVRDGCLVCPRHGWAFDTSGRCRSVPSLLPNEPLPANMRLEARRLEAAGGFYWLWHGATAPVAPPTHLVPEMDMPGHSILKIALLGDFRARDGLENLLDVTHVPFVHVFPHVPQEKQQLFARLLDIRRRASGVTLVGGVPAGGTARTLDDVDIRIEHAPPYGVRLEFPKAATDQPTAMAAYFTPRDEHTCHCEFVIVFPFPHGTAGANVVRIDHGAGADPFFTAGQLLDEDLRILRAQARNRHPGADPDRLVPGDALIAESRRRTGPRRRQVRLRCGFEIVSWPPSS